MEQYRPPKEKYDGPPSNEKNQRLIGTVQRRQIFCISWCKSNEIPVLHAIHILSASSQSHDLHRMLRLHAFVQDKYIDREIEALTLTADHPNVVNIFGTLKTAQT